MRLGLTTWSMVAVRAEEAIPLLASIGFDSVEIAVVPGWRDAVDLLTPARRRRIRQLLLEYDLHLAAIAGNTDLLADDPDELAENWCTLTRTVDLAAEWAARQGPPPVDTYVGGRPGEWDQKRDVLIERLGRLCDYAAERGVTIALQPHMDGALDTPEKVPILLDALARPNLGITLDINDFTVQGIPRAAGFDGDVCVEISLRVQRQPGFDPTRAITQSYAVLASAFETAGLTRHR